ncbi:MAG: hypothetical protein AB7O52_01120 [Planctomycetota bacterium]
MTDPNSTKRTVRWSAVVIIVLAALALRVGCWIQRPLIGADSARFLYAARAFEQGRDLDAIQDAYHPLTGYLIACVHRLAGAVASESDDPVRERDRRERCGYWVGIVSGLAVVLLLMEVVRLGFPGLSTVAVGWLAACHVFLIRSAADVMSDSVFLMLVLLCFRQALAAGTRRSWSAALSAGGAAGAAYLARPEGLILLGVVPVYWCWCARRELRSVVAWSAAFLVAAATLILPYAVAISLVSGSPTLTLKKALVPLTGVALPGLGTIPGGEVAAQLAEIVERWGSTCTWPIALFVGVGLLATVRRNGRALEPGTVLLGVAAVAMGAVLWRLVTVAGPGYLSRRHMLTLVAFSLPFVVRGVECVVQRFAPRRNSSTPISEPGTATSGAWPRLSVWVLGVLCVTGVPRALSPDRHDQISQKLAGEHILRAELGRPGAVVFSSREKVAYYGLADLRSIAERPLETLDRARALPKAWIAFYPDDLYGDDPVAFERDWSMLPDGFRHERSFGGEAGSKRRRLELFHWQQPH